jgi:hypothetical protein
MAGLDEPAQERVDRDRRPCRGGRLAGSIWVRHKAAADVLEVCRNGGQEPDRGPARESK